MDELFTVRLIETAKQLDNRAKREIGEGRVTIKPGLNGELLVAFADSDGFARRWADGQWSRVDFFLKYGQVPGLAVGSLDVCGVAGIIEKAVRERVAYWDFDDYLLGAALDFHLACACGKLAPLVGGHKHYPVCTIPAPTPIFDEDAQILEQCMLCNGLRPEDTGVLAWRLAERQNVNDRVRRAYDMELVRSREAYFRHLSGKERLSKVPRVDPTW